MELSWLGFQGVGFFRFHAQLQNPLITEFTLNYNRDPEYDLRHIPYLRGLESLGDCLGYDPLVQHPGELTVNLWECIGIRKRSWHPKRAKGYLL